MTVTYSWNNSKGAFLIEKKNQRRETWKGELNKINA